MMKLIPRFKTEYKTPDWDPNNPYHYHNNKGEKVVITPEEWEANVGKPYFREVEAAVRAEQAAYPGPEYEVNPAFIRDLNSSVAATRGQNGMLNYVGYKNQLPQGYTINENGIVFDKNGNAYVQESYPQSTKFTYNTNNPIRFTFNKGKQIESNVNFYPVNMDMRVKEPLPIDRVMNINKEKETSISNYMDNNKYYSPRMVFEGYEGDFYIPGSNLRFSYSLPYDEYPSFNNKEINKIKNQLKSTLGRDVNVIRRQGEVFIDLTNEEIKNFRDRNRDKFLWDVKPVKVSRKEAEKKAVISIGPLEKVKTFANGGYLFQKGGKVKGYKVSSGIMRLAQKFADKEAAKQNEEEGNGAPQSTFLMNRKNQQKVFEQEGYTKVDSDDYGPVTNAVKNSKHKDVPIYQKYPDIDVDRSNLVKIGTFMDSAIKGVHGETEIYSGPYESYLTDPANFPVDIYIDRKTGKVYNQGWDFNDYNNLRSTTGISKLKNVAGNVLDRIGNPTVVTTGLQENENPPSKIINDYISKTSNRFLQYNSDDGQIQLKPVTVTAQRTKKLIPKETKDLPTTEEFRNMSVDQLFDWLEQNRKK